ncbi:ribbon-helix-helix protein, CopG family [Rhodococcus jostii]|uniref:Ribbon-helix-helix protein, CopG family n=1 Tax=Rhodococcus jostii TaxID=132919 RepID=A0ABU4CT49_RHOJO|nr:ribbon-helix-helix protein, CopG family [Rhodococcus jostii]MDV6286751.1 ribbon-helix-helix protein, CopG family [Rhodococcus jostii]
MSETNMGRVPVGDPIPLRFDPTTKQRLEELAADIGPRRFGALVRVAARRLLADPDRVPEALDQSRRASADARRIPWAERPLDLDPATSTRLNELAQEFHTDRSAIVRVAVHRFLTGAGRFRHPVLREDARTDLTCRTRVYLNRSTLVRLEKLISRNGDALTSAAAIRVAVRRLLDDPGDLAADLATIGAARDLTPEVLGPRTNVHFDDDLRDQLDTLAGRLDSDRAELMRLAARQLLANPRDLDQAVTEEIYRGDANRDLLIARNTRRRQTADQATAAPPVRKAPSPQGSPFGKRHVFRFDEDTKRRLEELADEYGPRRMSALLRVGIRRLIENPAADEALAQARRVAAPPRTARVDVALDDELLAHLDALAERLGSNRQELVHLAATRILRFHHNIENRMLDEMFRAQNNRKHLLAKHARREWIRRMDRGSGT